MPSNQQTHSVRIQKIKVGFVAGKLDHDQINHLLAMFDLLSDTVAREIAERTRFSVSTFSKIGQSNDENRREMARALLFVADLRALWVGARGEKRLAIKKTDEEFKTLWQGDEQQLGRNLQAAAKALVDDDVAYRKKLEDEKLEIARRKAEELENERRRLEQLEIARRTAEQLEQAQRRAEQLEIEKESKILEWLKAKNPVKEPGKLELAGRFESIEFIQKRKYVNVKYPNAVTQVHTLWVSAKVMHLEKYTVSLGNKLSNMLSIQTAATAAYREFEELFSAQAKDTSFKVSLAKKLFNAIKEYAPWPLSLVGKAGEAICGVLHVDEDIRQIDVLGPPIYFGNKVPVLAKASEKIATIKNFAEDLTRVGVSNAKLDSAASIHDQIDTAKTKALEVLTAVFKQGVKDVFGDTVKEVEDKSLRYLLDVIYANPDVSDQGIVALATTKISILAEKTVQSLDDLGAVTFLDAHTLQPFIELQLFAQLMASIAPPSTDIGAVAVPANLIARLNDKKHNLIRLKSEKGTSLLIYAQGYIPWADHPRHRAAVVLFFRWYAAKVNPFQIAFNKKTPRQALDAMRSVIGRIGVGLKDFEETHWFTHSTANYAKVESEVMRIAF
jgi:hypothetical protein